MKTITFAEICLNRRRILLMTDELLKLIEEGCNCCVFLNKRPDGQLYCEKNCVFTIDNLKGKICRFKKTWR
jgi:hypothetical protein